MPRASRARPSWVGRLFSGELFCDGPVGIVTLEDAVAVAVEAERDAMGGDHGLQGAEITESIFGFQLEVSGQDLAGSVVLKADQGELGDRGLRASRWRLASVSAIMPKQGTGQAAGAILGGPTLLRRGQFGGAQDAAHGFAAEGEVLLGLKFFGRDGNR